MAVETVNRLQRVARTGPHVKRHYRVRRLGLLGVIASLSLLVAGASVGGAVGAVPGSSVVESSPHAIRRTASAGTATTVARKFRRDRPERTEEEGCTMAPLTSDGGVAVPSVPVHRAFTEEQLIGNGPLRA